MHSEGSTFTAGRRGDNQASGGLSGLDKAVLTPANRALYEDAVRTCRGSAAWRNRKMAEAYELLALSQLTSRFRVDFLDLRETLRILAYLQVPVPLRPDESGRLRTAACAFLGIRLVEGAMREPRPGSDYVQVLQPEGVWHANVHGWSPQVLCLGALMPVGIPLKEIVFLTYGALSLQSVMIDERSAGGVMNPEAARWWQHNMGLIPLSRAPFLSQE